MAVSEWNWPFVGAIALLGAFCPPVPPPPLPSTGSPAGTAWLPSWRSPSPGFLLPSVSCSPLCSSVSTALHHLFRDTSCPSCENGLPGPGSVRSAHLGELVEGWAGWTPRLSRTPPLDLHSGARGGVPGGFWGPWGPWAGCVALSVPSLCFWPVPRGTCLFNELACWIGMKETPPFTARLAWRTPEGLGGR